MHSDSDDDWRDSCRIVQEKHSHLLETGKFSDVVFLVGENGVPIHAHKLILMVASPVFETQFGGRWNEEDNNIQIPDVTPKAFEVFLKFLYTDEFSVTEVEAEDVLSLAHKYMIKSLAKECSELLGSLMKVSNAIDLYRIATKFSTVEESLQQKAMEFILKNGSAVMEDDGFLQIDHETLSMILENDKLRSDEIIVFRAVMRWAENKCKVEKLDCTVQIKRIILKDLIHLIRFTWMTPQDFTNEVSFGKHEGILSESESFAILKHLSAGPSVRSLLPPLPFNVIKRHGGLLHKIDIQEAGLGNSNMGRHCRYTYGYGTTRCERTFEFRSNRCICIKAIEFRQSIYVDSLGNYNAYLVYNESGCVSPEIFVVMSLVEGMDTLTGSFLPQMTPNIESVNGFDIEKDKNYNMDLVIASNGGTTNVSPGVGLSLSDPVKVVDQEDVHITFTTQSSQCHRQGQQHFISPDICICSGQIKTIYFTF